jgi:taurine transport system ATP-binding protein
MSEPIISLNNVSKTFVRSEQETPALRNISLDIYEGDFVVVLGPSGCGKSTLLNIIAGYIEPTTGTCLMHGVPIKKPDANRGVVFQSANLYPWLTVKNNINFSLRMKKENKKVIEEKTAVMLDEIMLTDFKEYYPHELSGGMRQRVSLGRSLINDPEILLLDEPFGALDALTRSSMQTLLLELWKDKRRTLFLITHDIEEALTLASKILVMKKNPGEIAATFEVNFNLRMKESDYRVTLDPKFIELKNEIIELIR